MKPSIKWIKENIKGIIFDLDGTLVDSMWMWHAIDVEYLAGFGLELPDDYQSKIEGLSFHEVAVYTKERFHIPDSTDQMKDDWNRMAYSFYQNRVPLKSGVLQLLNVLKENGIRLGIATSNSRELLECVLNSHQIMQYFDVIATSSEVTRGKPAPDIYLHVSDLLCVSPDNILVFEDVLAGIQSGKAAGMQVCGVYDAYSLQPRDELEAVSDYYIESFEDLLHESE